MFKWFISKLEELGGIGLLGYKCLRYGAPLRGRLWFKQIERTGIDSLPVIVLSSAFIGMVFVIQTFYALRKFGAESMVGVSLALAMVRELGPVFTGVMLTARAGAAMAAELGSMRVTEQIDAMEAMAINPISYLIVPRILALTLVSPILTSISDFIGVAGGYGIGVWVLGVNPGAFISNIEKYVNLSDIYYGLIKSCVFLYY
jgi:phospholipid/cholesterol/gamma-HCH transport system permease protein